MVEDQAGLNLRGMGKTKFAALSDTESPTKMSDKLSQLRESAIHLPRGD
jgi:hypothetical protein